MNETLFFRADCAEVIVESWFVAMKQKSCLKSALSSIVNCMNGVQTRFKKAPAEARDRFLLRFLTRLISLKSTRG